MLQCWNIFLAEKNEINKGQHLEDFCGVNAPLQGMELFDKIR